MLNIKYKNKELVVSDPNKKEFSFNIENKKIILDWFDISYPWEYEKSGILVETKEYNNELFYNFLIDKKRLVIITTDNFELKEEILTFFWDVDVLIIIGSKESAKIFESIEAKIVIPYWEAKDLFLHTLWQNIEEESSYKVKNEFSLDSTEFVNLV